MKYAVGRRAKTICDLCGQTIKYKNRKKMWDGNIVGKCCWNKKEESLDPQKYMPRGGDAIALRDGRPGDFDEVGETDAQDYIDSIKEQP